MVNCPLCCENIYKEKEKRKCEQCFREFCKECIRKIYNHDGIYIMDQCYECNPDGYLKKKILQKIEILEKELRNLKDMIYLDLEDDFD